MSSTTSAEPKSQRTRLRRAPGSPGLGKFTLGIANAIDSPLAPRARRGQRRFFGRRRRGVTGQAEAALDLGKRTVRFERGSLARQVGDQRLEPLLIAPAIPPGVPVGNERP